MIAVEPIIAAGVRIAIVEGADAPWSGEAVVDQIGLVLDGREFWCADDFRGMLLVEAGADELALLAASEIEESAPARLSS